LFHCHIIQHFLNMLHPKYNTFSHVNTRIKLNFSLEWKYWLRFLFTAGKISYEQTWNKPKQSRVRSVTRKNDVSRMNFKTSWDRMGKGYKNRTTIGISEEFQECYDIYKPESNLFTRFTQFLNALKKNSAALRPVVFRRIFWISERQPHNSRRNDLKFQTKRSAKISCSCYEEHRCFDLARLTVTHIFPFSETINLHQIHL
jgi:hypothetical protein